MRGIGETEERAAGACAQEGLLSERLEGSLHGLGRFRLAAHLARCERCRAVLRSLTRAVEQLRLLGETDFQPPPTASLADQVSERIRRDQPIRHEPG